MRVILATAKQKVVDCEAYSVVLPGMSGQIEVLKDHAVLLTLLGNGLMRIKGSEGNESHCFMLRGGFAQVNNNQVTVLSEQADVVSVAKTTT